MRTITSLWSDAMVLSLRSNIGQVAIAMGDLGLAYQAFKIAISVDNNHAESYCNLGVSNEGRGGDDAL